jgi:hypothetical protein
VFPFGGHQAIFVVLQPGKVRKPSSFNSSVAFAVIVALECGTIYVATDLVTSTT